MDADGATDTDTDEAERQANRSAQFYSDDLGTLARAAGADRAMALPAVKVGGVLVFAYVRDRVMRVSVDLDDADEYWPEGQPVPLKITVQGRTVFESPAAPGHQEGQADE